MPRPQNEECQPNPVCLPRIGVDKEKKVPAIKLDPVADWTQAERDRNKGMRTTSVKLPSLDLKSPSNGASPTRKPLKKHNRNHMESLFDQQIDERDQDESAKQKIEQRGNHDEETGEYCKWQNINDDSNSSSEPLAIEDINDSNSDTGESPHAPIVLIQERKRRETVRLPPVRGVLEDVCGVASRMFSRAEQEDHTGPW